MSNRTTQSPRIKEGAERIYQRAYHIGTRVRGWGDYAASLHATGRVWEYYRRAGLEWWRERAPLNLFRKQGKVTESAGVDAR